MTTLWSYGSGECVEVGDEVLYREPYSVDRQGREWHGSCYNAVVVEASDVVVIHVLRRQSNTAARRTKSLYSLTRYWFKDDLDGRIEFLGRSGSSDITKNARIAKELCGCNCRGN